MKGKDPEEGCPEVVRTYETEHECRVRSRIHGRAEEARSPSPRDWGEAVDRVVRLDGIWWAVAGRMSPEYSTPIRYCPWCGVQLSKRLRATRRDPGVGGGHEVFAGTRVPVATLVDILLAGGTVEEFLAEFPSVERWHVEAVLEQKESGADAS